MSKSILALSFAAAAALATTSFAVTPSGAPGEVINHLGAAEDYSRWSFAVHAGVAEKAYRKDPVTDFSRVNAIIGFDLTRWFSVYGVAGTMEQKIKIGDSSVTDDSGLFGAGIWANLMQSEQLSIFDSVDRYTISTGAEITYAGFDSDTWLSLDAFLAFEIQGDVGRQAFIFPRTVGIYFGPVVSVSLSSDYDTSSSNAIGFGGGVNVKFTDDVYLKVGGDFFSDDSTVYGQFGINF